MRESRLVALLAAVACCFGQGLAEPPPLRREFRGAWVATVSNIDWPSSKNLTTSQQKQEVLTILDKAVALRLNALLVQVRPACDAFYASVQEPWSEYLNGLMGRAPNPYYDPLAYWIDEAHKRGIELHAWFNPYRARVKGATSPVAPNHVTQTNPNLVRDYDGYKWLDPGEPGTPDYTLNAIMDVVSRYDVDGAVFDDYFYPYPVAGVAFPDDSSYAAYLASGGTLSRDNWRRDNVNRFVQRVYTSIKAVKPWVKFGISPFGIWRPGNPPGINGLDAYASLYADSRLWIRSGWCDYFSPQLYWKISATAQSYPALLNWWTQQNLVGRHMWPANFTSQVSGNSGGWPVQEIVDQINVTRAQPGAGGNVHFSMKVFLQNRLGINDVLMQGVYAQQAAVPASPWLDPTMPAQPAMKTMPGTRSTTHLFLFPGDTEPVWLWAVYLRYGDIWTYQIIPGGVRQLAYPSSGAGGYLMEAGLSVLDRCGNESPRRLLQIRAP